MIGMHTVCPRPIRQVSRALSSGLSTTFTSWQLAQAPICPLPLRSPTLAYYYISVSISLYPYQCPTLSISKSMSIYLCLCGPSCPGNTALLVVQCRACGFASVAPDRHGSVARRHVAVSINSVPFKKDLRLLNRAKACLELILARITCPFL